MSSAVKAEVRAPKSKAFLMEYHLDNCGASIESRRDSNDGNAIIFESLLPKGQIENLPEWAEIARGRSRR